MTKSIRWWKHESAIVDEGATIGEGTKTDILDMFARELSLVMHVRLVRMSL